MTDELKCLLCGKPLEEDGNRGLCSSHYSAVMYRLRTKYGTDTPERKLAEQALIDEGLLLPKHRTGPKSDPKMKLVEVHLRKVDHLLAQKRRQETVEKSEELIERLGRKVAEETDDYPATKAKPKKGSK